MAELLARRVGGGVPRGRLVRHRRASAAARCTPTCAWSTSTAKQVNALDALNGYDAEGKLYLPGGAAQEAHLNYEPSVLAGAGGRLLLGAVYQPAHVRQHHRAWRQPAAGRRHLGHSAGHRRRRRPARARRSGSRPSTSIIRAAPTRAIPRSTCRGKSSSRATCALSRRSSPARRRAKAVSPLPSAATASAAKPAATTPARRFSPCSAAARNACANIDEACTSRRATAAAPKRSASTSAARAPHRRPSGRRPSERIGAAS